MPQRLADAGHRPAAPAPRDMPGWLGLLAATGEEYGEFHRLGDRHYALLHDDSARLLVTFEQAEAVRARAPDALPRGRALARAQGWSQLCLMAEGPTWWRDPAVVAHVDGLIDSGFFDEFDRVVFYGAGAAGHAAAAYSVAAPGATVVAVQPQATLDPRLAGWDRRFPAARRLDFTSRYGFAPAMLEGAARAFVIFDPDEPADAMHAALFARPWVTLLRAPHFGPGLDRSLRRMGLLDQLLRAAMAGSLDAAAFARLMRARRDHGPYLRRMVRLAEAAGRPRRAAMVCRSAVARCRAPYFRRRLAELEAAGTA
jgi:hypothetical protein